MCATVPIPRDGPLNDSHLRLLLQTATNNGPKLVRGVLKKALTSQQALMHVVYSLANFKRHLLYASKARFQGSLALVVHTSKHFLIRHGLCFDTLP